MHGTRSVRLPSAFSWSTAIPSPTCLWLTTPGLPEPSTSPTKAEFITGMSWSARTTAYPMMWVKLTLAPEVLANWLFRISRLTSRSRAGTVLTLVAVGTLRLASILATTREAAPRNTVAESEEEADEEDGGAVPVVVAAGVATARAGVPVDVTPGPEVASGAIESGAIEEVSVAVWGGAIRVAVGVDGVPWVGGAGTGAGR